MANPHERLKTIKLRNADAPGSAPIRVPAVKSVGMGDMSQDVVVSSTRTAGRHGVGAVGLGSPSEFLDQHHAQRQQTLELITAAEARGHGRLAEMNRTLLSNLDTIIDTLETPETTEHAL